MRKRCGIFIFFILLGFFVLYSKKTVMAAETSADISVTVPTDIQIVFRGNGTNAISEFSVENQSLLPIEVQTVKVSEYNDWELVSDGTYIFADTKRLALRLEEQCLFEGENEVNLTVPEQTVKKLNMDVKRGAWTQSVDSQKAIHLELEYEFGTKEFQLYLDGNGVSGPISPMNVKNGETVTLPVLEKPGYTFAGWQDENGNLYTKEYVMPIGDVILVAAWKEIKAYAIYSADDLSLTFVQSSEAIREGELYNGKIVTSVYSGFEEEIYTSYKQVPWYADGVYADVQSVIVKDVISPVSTAYWFYFFESCMNLELTNLNTEQVIDMQYMFHRTGRLGIGDFTIIGLDSWDVTNVTSMQNMFAYTGIYATSYDIGDLGNWNVSNVTSMRAMFLSAGMRATTFTMGDLSRWNTSGVSNMASMFSTAGKNADKFDIGNIGSWNVSKVMSMGDMFREAGSESDTFYIGDISNWDVGNVASMTHMFAYAGRNASIFEIGNLQEWNVSNVTDFTAMFWETGTYASTFNIGDLSNWNTASATSMSAMFRSAGLNAVWYLDCGKWNVNKVIYHDTFNGDVETKVTPPKWVN